MEGVIRWEEIGDMIWQGGIGMSGGRSIQSLSQSVVELKRRYHLTRAMMMMSPEQVTTEPYCYTGLYIY